MLVNVALPVCGAAAASYGAQNQLGGDHGAYRLRTFEGVEPMGRGRAKAKQVKVARQLKYKSDDTDLDRLRAELGVGGDTRDGNYGSAAGDYDDDDDDEDPGSELSGDARKDAEDAWPR
jgi:Protein of unknown function (DUF3073)